MNRPCGEYANVGVHIQPLFVGIKANVPRLGCYTSIIGVDIAQAEVYLLVRISSRRKPFSVQRERSQA